MPARTPEISLSSDDRRLLVLLARLIADDEWSGPNVQRQCEVVLSDSEARELVNLLEEFMSSRRFVDGSHFVEMLFSSRLIDDEPARETYLSWRKRRGRSRAMASTHWQEFLVRIGLSNDKGGYWRAAPIVGAKRMEIAKFLQLERMLLNSTDLQPRVRDLVMQVVSSKTASIEAIRNGEARLPQGSLTKLPKRLSDEINSSRVGIGVKPMSTQKIAGVITIVTDMGVLFTTRDWNVVGTLSSLAGALVAASE